MSESKPDRFRRVVEARVNKIIKMVRLLGNCSNVNVYTFTTGRDEIGTYRGGLRKTREYRDSG